MNNRELKKHIRQQLKQNDDPHKAFFVSFDAKGNIQSEGWFDLNESKTPPPIDLGDLKKRPKK